LWEDQWGSSSIQTGMPPHSCGVCGGLEFAETEEGELVCVYCAAVLTGRSNEAAEEDANPLVGAGVSIRTRHGVTRSGKVGVSGPSLKVLSGVECLRCLQCILLRVSVALGEIVGGDDILQAAVKKYWFALVRKWNACGVYPISACFQQYHMQTGERLLYAKWEQQSQTSVGLHSGNFSPSLNARKRQGGTQSAYKSLTVQPDAGELVAPSMPLVLALVYLACRWVQNGIVPMDLVRWCRDGTLPYFSGFSFIPSELLSAAKHIQGFFTPAFVPSPSQITFLCCRLATAIEITMPPINLEAVGMRYALSLGLPSASVEAFWSLVASARRRPDSRLHVFLDHASPMHVMALLVVSVRLCPGWHKWTRSLPHSDVAVPSCEDDLSRLKRKYLLSYMQTCEDSFLASLSHIGAEVSTHAAQGYTATLGNMAHSANHPQLRSQTGATNRKQHFSQRLAYQRGGRSGGCSSMLLYDEQSAVERGLFYHPAFCVLLETCAAHLETHPHILGRLVHKLDSILSPRDNDPHLFGLCSRKKGKLERCKKG
jgi:hypothetical protein